MKRASTAQDDRPKKAKLSKLSKQLQLQSQQMDEIIELVASQSDVGGKVVDRKNDSVDDVQDNADEFAEAPADSHKSHKSHKSQLTVECRKMRTEITKLSSIIREQQKKISSMEAMLTKVLSLLESTGASTGQRGHPTPASWVAAPVASSSQSRRQHTNSTVDNTATSRKSTQNESGQGAWHARNAGITHDQDDGHFTMIVHRTLNDMSRRKNNVVITGLLEEKDTGKSDSESFVEFCENFMPIKPVLNGPSSCRRIGKSTDGRPRRLLVHLQSKETADELLEAAPQLRYCDDSYVASNIFINEDLSPAEAKLAYEARQKRRDRQQRHSANFVGSDEINIEDHQENNTSKNVLPIQHAVSPGKNVEAASFTMTSRHSASPTVVVPVALHLADQIAAPDDAPVPSSSTFH